MGDYWYGSGTPTHLTEMLSRYPLRPEEMEGVYAEAATFDAPTEKAASPVSILFQSGYLTIKKSLGSTYLLGFPNEEVRLGFLRGLMPYYSKSAGDGDSVFLVKLTMSLRLRDIEQAMRLFRSFFSSVPYDAGKQDEAHYNTMFYLIFRLAAPFAVRTEERSAAGRYDALVESEDTVYVFEFKLRGDAQEAQEQIDDRGYLIPYEAGRQRLYKIGVSFDEELKPLKELVVAEA